MLGKETKCPGCLVYVQQTRRQNEQRRYLLMLISALLRGVIRVTCGSDIGGGWEPRASIDNALRATCDAAHD